MNGHRNIFTHVQFVVLTCKIWLDIRVDKETTVRSDCDLVMHFSENVKFALHSCNLQTLDN